MLGTVASDLFSANEKRGRSIGLADHLLFYLNNVSGIAVLRPDIVSYNQENPG
jgi:hypothetical protein